MRALGRLDELADEVRGAGLTVTLHVGELPDLPTDIDLAAIRVIQESLTNSLRHAGPGSSVWITARVEGDHLEIQVVDDGRGKPMTDHRVDGGHGTTRGTGLRGMRERVELHGGVFAAAPVAPRGWGVTARIPLDGCPDEDGAAGTAVQDVPTSHSGERTGPAPVAASSDGVHA